MHRLSIHHEKSSTEQGHKANQLPICRHCGIEMVLRTSRLYLHQKIFTNGMMYKCAECDWVKMYEVPCDEGHFKSILGLRNNKSVFYPSLEQFKENELIKKKLESIGYF